MDDRQLDLRAVFGPLKRQFALIAAVFVVLLVATTLVIFTLKPAYTSTALVQVDPSQKNLLNPTAELPGSASDSGRVEGEVELAKSDAVLLRAIRDGNLLNEGSFAPQPSWLAFLLDATGIKAYEAPTGEDLLDDVLNKLERAISVSRRGLTFLVAIDARSTDPEEAAALANLVARTYIATQLGRILVDEAIDRIFRSGQRLAGFDDARLDDVARAEHCVDLAVELGGDVGPRDEVREGRGFLGIGGPRIDRNEEGKAAPGY